MPAGQPVTVRGIGVGAAEPIRLVLVGIEGSSFELGAVESDDEGGFETLVTVPSDIATGTHGLRAVLTDGDHVDADLVVGAAVAEPGELPGADEPLLQPPPTPSAASGGVPVSPAPAAPGDVGAVAAQDPSGSRLPVAALAIGVGLLASAIVAAGILRGRRGRAGG